ncbi:hypothetical protein SKAU_G00297210, partial [Synaphobranchus kaupii]
QALTQEGTEGVSSGSKQLLTATLRELEGQCSRAALFERDVASFLWAESPGDLASDAAWVGVAQRGAQPQQQRSGLAMKTQALTPCVQTVCAALDAKLKAQLDDLQHYLPFEPRPAGAASAFDRFADAGVVEDTLREHCLACMRDVLSSVRGELAVARGRPARAPPPPRSSAPCSSWPGSASRGPALPKPEAVRPGKAGRRRRRPYRKRHPPSGQEAGERRRQGDGGEPPHRRCGRGLRRSC